MNLRQLELFVAVAETGSFSRAAEIVYLTQSSVSQHIASLEAEVGTKLLDRTSKGAELTSGGKTFLLHARRVLADRNTLLQAMVGFQGLQNVRLTIGASNIPASYLVPQLLPRLAQSYPGVTLNMRTGDSQEIIDGLLKGETELAIVGDRSDHKDLSFQPLVNDQLELIVGPDHPWRGRKQITPDELVGEPLIVRELGSGSGRTLEKALRGVGCDPSRLTVAAQLGSNEAILQAVATGFGCAFVSKFSIRQRLTQQEVFVVRVEALSVVRQLWLATMRARTTSPAAQALSELFFDFVTELETQQL